MLDRRPVYSAAIIGAGAAGAALGRLLASRGLSVALIDPRPPGARDFRAEKLTPEQWAQVRVVGLKGVLEPEVTFEEQVWIARRGRLIERRDSGNRNCRYPRLVSVLRSSACEQPNLIFFEQRVSGIAISEDFQEIRLADDRLLTARLAIVATGAGDFLPKNLGFQRRIISAAHSLSAGFDVAPAQAQKFAFPALTYFAERPSDRLAYLSLFPIGDRMRANLFLYHDVESPSVRRLLSAPERALFELMPRLSKLAGEFAPIESVALRPIDLYRMENVRRPGVVLIGDSFASACPASGSGLSKVFSDVARLAALLPQWLATPGMGERKISSFYEDQQKRAVDAASLAQSRSLREMSTRDSLPWRLHRGLRFMAQATRGAWRERGVVKINA